LQLKVESGASNGECKNCCKNIRDWPDQYDSFSQERKSCEHNPKLILLAVFCGFQFLVQFSKEQPWSALNGLKNLL
jgi:hypothetical protein